MQGPTPPTPPAGHKEDTCLPVLTGGVTTVRGYNLCTVVRRQDQQNPGLALGVRITLGRNDYSMELKWKPSKFWLVHAEDMRPRLPRIRCGQGSFTRVLHFKTGKLRPWAGKCLPKVTQSWAGNRHGQSQPRLLLLHGALGMGDEDREGCDQGIGTWRGEPEGSCVLWRKGGGV